RGQSRDVAQKRIDADWLTGTRRENRTGPVRLKQRMGGHPPPVSNAGVARIARLPGVMRDRRLQLAGHAKSISQALLRPRAMTPRSPGELAAEHRDQQWHAAEVHERRPNLGRSEQQQQQRRQQLTSAEKAP